MAASQSYQTINDPLLNTTEINSSLTQQDASLNEAFRINSEYRSRSSSRSSLSVNSLDLERNPNIIRKPPNQNKTNNTGLSSWLETCLVYGHILEIVAGFTCLLVVVNVMLLARHQTSNEVLPVRALGAIGYGLSMYVGTVAMLLALGFLFVMVRTRFKYSQAGIPKPNTSYATVLLGSHVIMGAHWGVIAFWLSMDAGYVDCYKTTDPLQFTSLLIRVCDLTWLVKFLAMLNLSIWSGLSLFIALFVNKFYNSVLTRWFPDLHNYGLDKAGR